MGCISSTPEEAPQPKETSQSAAVTSSAVATKSTASDKNSYETSLSASLSDSTNANVPFHGILGDSNKLNLTRQEDSVQLRNKLFDLPTSNPNDGEQSDAQQQNNLIVISGKAMTMPYTVIISPTAEEIEKHKLQQEDVEKIIVSLFNEYNGIINGWNQKSEICKINSLRPEKKFQISNCLLQLFEIVDEMHEVTNGKFDPTVGSVSAAFENCIISNQRPPLPNELQRLKFAVGWRKVIKKNTNNRQNTVEISRLNAHTIIELDGISKGFVIDKLVGELCPYFTNLYVDWAGDVRVTGRNLCNDRLWKSTVVRPPELKRLFVHWKNNSLKCMLNTSDIGYVVQYSDDCSIATSGDYFSIQKFGFHHIINVNNLSVLKASNRSVASVCIVASTCAVADAIATATMAFDSIQPAILFLTQLQKSHPHFIFGYLVMGRKQTDNDDMDDYELFTTAHFSRISPARLQQQPSNTTTAQSDDNDRGVEESEEMGKVIGDKVFTFPVKVQYQGRSTEIHSFTSCSMHPYPIATFTVPYYFIENVKPINIPTYAVEDDSVMDRNEEQNHLTCTFVVIDEENNEKNMTSEFEIKNIVPVENEKSIVVVAYIKDVSFGDVLNYYVRHSDKKVKRTINLSDGHNNKILRSNFPLLSIADKSKQLFRHFPSNIWIVLTEGVDSTLYCLTATSVSIANGIITFNVAHSSAFYAGFDSGINSVFQVFALSSETHFQSIARKFVSQCRPNQNDISLLQSDSLVSAKCKVTSPLHVQDHLVVHGRIFEIAHQNNHGKQPLVWIGGEYVLWS